MAWNMQQLYQFFTFIVCDNLGGFSAD